MVADVHSEISAAPQSVAVAESSSRSRLGLAILRMVLLLLPGTWIVGVDLWRRSRQIRGFVGDEFQMYVLTSLVSLGLWASLVALTTARSRTLRWLSWIALVGGAVLALGGQTYLFARFGAYLNFRAVLVGTSMMPSVGQQLWSDRITFLRSLGIPLAVVIASAVLFRRAGETLSQTGEKWFADLGLTCAFFAIFHGAPMFGSEQGASFDVLYVSSTGRLVNALWTHDEEAFRVHPGPRTPIPLPQLTPKSPYGLTGAKARPNVIMIVNESVRAADSCIDYTTDCATQPRTNRLTPKRFPLMQMRSLDSTTAISVAVMWTGLGVDATRTDLHTMPLAWEYAHAAGFSTAYWTSQNLFFANAGIWLDGIPLDAHVSATELDPDATYEEGADDGALADRVLSDLDRLAEPFFGVVHLSNTHFPYKSDTDAPFQPDGTSIAGDSPDALRNRYRNAFYRQDKAIAKLVEGVRARDRERKTVVVYLSDHGEQIRERGAVGHTEYLFDEETHVPMWIDAPEGTLSQDAVQSLEQIRDRPRTMIDVLPTLLDLFGVWSDEGLSHVRPKLRGESLLRGGSPEDRAVLISNCTPIFACAFKNWGALRGSRKLFATQSDQHWRCFDVLADPTETRDLGLSGCPGMREVAEGDRRGTPF